MKKTRSDTALDALPPLSDAQRALSDALARMPEDSIDTSDQPELTEAQLSEMQRAEYFRPIKKQITARLDADVLEWLKSGGKGYQTRMNTILRQAMLKAK